MAEDRKGGARASAKAALKESEARLRLLSDAGLMLARTLDHVSALKEVAPRTLGILGDACFVDLLDESGNIVRVAWAHADKEQQKAYDALWPTIRPSRYSLHPMAIAISEGMAIFEPEINDAWLERMAMGEDHLAFLRSSSVHSAIIVPLRMASTPFGAITFWFTKDKQRRHTAKDLDLAQELGRRASIAIAHARQHQALGRLNAELEAEVAQRTRERDRIWLVSDDLMAVGDARNGYLTTVNPAWTRVLGYDEATLLSTPFREFGDPQALGNDAPVVEQFGRGQMISHYEARMRRSDGAWRWISWTVVPEGDRFYAVGRDITEQHAAADELAAANRQLRTEIEERERVEATLHQMRRLEAIGQLTSGVSHDFNNLLTVLLGNIAFLERQFIGTGDKKLTQRLANMRAAAERGAKLTSQLLAFSRRQHLEPEALALNEVVRGMRDLMQTAMGAVRIETMLADDLWLAFADATQIELVILNLALNARDAMTDGGTVTIATANVSLAAPSSAEEPSQGDYVDISVTDTGAGMAPDVLMRAFEPFFTTKDTGRGSGLGLSQVLGFAKQSGGGVKILSRPGAGTEVHVYLPKAVVMPAMSPAGNEAPTTSSKAVRVLLVDDEAPVREIIAATLRELGHDVIEAGSAGAALELLDHDPALDIALLDFAMPGMNGAELARQIRARRPGLGVLFVTGYAGSEALADVADECIVKKPFRQADLARKLNAAIAAQAA